MRARRGTWVVCVLGLALRAAAQEPPEVGLTEDPHIDRAWLSPTAATNPAGSFEVNDWEIVLLGFTYGVADNVQLSAAFVPPLVKDQPFVGYGSLKIGLIPEGRVRFAASLTLGIAEADSETRGAGAAGGIVSVCTDDRCSSLLSGFALAGFAIGNSQHEVPIVFGGSLVQRISDSVKLVVEIDSAGWFGSDSDSGLVQGALLDYGVRFFGKNMAGDIGFVRPFIFYRDTDNPFILGYPMVTFSYRWGVR